MYHCVSCGLEVRHQRWQLGFKTCLDCGELEARQYRHTIVPLAKSNYQPIRDLSLLRQLNKYAQ